MISTDRIQAQAAVNKGVADGLFSWAAWPWGNQDMDTYVDASYQTFEGGASSGGGKPYMMGVSPWFYTNLPGFGKNWMWKGDDLWFDRWQQVLWFQPDLVEIISWNDWGESHYIGPLQSDANRAAQVFTPGRAPFDYTKGMPHDGWLATLPWFIELYKSTSGQTTMANEVLSAWYRPNPVTYSPCNRNGTTLNTHSQYQQEFLPDKSELVDRIFFTVIAASSPTVTVTIGGSSVTVTMSHTPYGGIGAYHGYADFSNSNKVGTVVVKASTAKSPNMVVPNTIAITTACSNGLTNYNAWAGSILGTNAGVSNTKSLYDMGCTKGTAPGNFLGLCQTSCMYGYCPRTACHCLELGVPPSPVIPTPAPPSGYPKKGEDASYKGLCAYDCSIGTCYSEVCTTVSAALTTATVSPFTPLACTAGVALPAFPQYAGLCSNACGHGFCPINICKCTGQNAQLPIPATTQDTTATATDGTDDNGLCKWNCDRGYCPFPCNGSHNPVCTTTTSPKTSTSLGAFTPLPTTDGLTFTFTLVNATPYKLTRITANPPAPVPWKMSQFNFGDVESGNYTSQLPTAHPDRANRKLTTNYCTVR
jgi:hypothetical protein